jgi:hypothetical protein
MKKRAFTLIAGMALSLGFTACTQAPAPVAAAPAETSAPAPAPPVVVEERRPTVVVENHPRPVVVEENHSRPGVNISVHKRDDGDHTSVDIHARP